MSSGQLFKGEILQYGQEPTKLEISFLDRECATEGCTEDVQRLMTVPGASIGRDQSKTFYVDRCINCFYDTGVFSFQYDGSGKIIWEDEGYGQCEELLDDQCNRNSKASVQWTPITADDLEDWDTNYGLRAGGLPEFLQGESIFECPKCDKEMEFILQLPSRSMDKSWNKHWKGTDLERFEISIERYATLYLFRCEACNVSTTFTQCT